MVGKHGIYAFAINIMKDNSKSVTPLNGKIVLVTVFHHRFHCYYECHVGYIQTLVCLRIVEMFYFTIPNHNQWIGLL